MKVFLSHQRKDSLRAADIAIRLKQNGLDVYLDIADETAQLGVDDLTAHIQKQMTSCTQLMAVISYNARESWWVPWEVGVATEKSYPIASFALDTTSIPEYLRRWPYLTSLPQVDAYCAEAKRLYSQYVTASITTRTRSVSDFYKALKARLGQP